MKWDYIKLIGIAISTDKNHIYTKDGWKKFCQKIIERCDYVEKIHKWKEGAKLLLKKEQISPHEYRTTYPYTCNEIQKKSSIH